MDGVIVKRFYGGGNGGDDRCRLSVLSPKDLSSKVACVNLSLPSYIDDKHITCGGGCGLLYFDDFQGNIVLCNLTTKQLKYLPPPPKVKPRFDLFATGLGYDSKSDDFKVIRFLRQDFYKRGRYQGNKDRCELYSLKSGVWKDVPIPEDVIVTSSCGVYVGGRCYWKALLGFSLGGPSSDYGDDIVSLDFTTESFHCLHSPPCGEGRDVVFDLVEYRGSLGAIGFNRSDDPTGGFGFELWVREECSWTKVFDVVLSNVESVPLGLIDGRFLFLQRKGCNELNQLVVYDWITKEWKELDIYDYDQKMEIAFYVEGQVALPDAMPMQRSYTHEEEKEIDKRKRKRSDDWSDDDDSCKDDEDDGDSVDSCMGIDDEEDNDDSCKDDEDDGDSGDSCMAIDDEEEEEEVHHGGLELGTCDLIS